MLISLHKANTRKLTARKMAAGVYWVITLSLFGFELVLCSATVDHDVQRILASYKTVTPG